MFALLGYPNEEIRSLEKWHMHTALTGVTREGRRLPEDKMPQIGWISATVALQWVAWRGDKMQTIRVTRSSWESGAIDLRVSLVPLVNRSELSSTIEAASSRPIEV